MGISELSIGRKDVYKIPIEKIRIVEGRNIRFEDFGDLQMLSLQLIAEGQIEPILGRCVKDEGGEEWFEIVDGERRYRAAKIAIKDHGWKTTTLNCVSESKEATDITRVITMLLANESKPLTPIERATAYKRLVDSGVTAKEISLKMGCTQASIRDMLLLISAPETIQKAVRDHKMSTTAGVNAAKATPERQARIMEKAERGEQVRVKDTQEKRTQYSIAEIKSAMDAACHECALKCDLITMIGAINV